MLVCVGVHEGDLPPWHLVNISRSSGIADVCHLAILVVRPPCGPLCGDVAQTCIRQFRSTFAMSGLGALGYVLVDRGNFDLIDLFVCDMLSMIHSH